MPPAMQSDPVRTSLQRSRRLPLPCHPASRCLLAVGLCSACISPDRTNLPTCTLGAAPGSEQAGGYQQERGPRMCCCSVLPHRGCPGPVGCAEHIPWLSGPPVKKEGLFSALGAPQRRRVVCSQLREPWAPGMVAEWICTGAGMALDQLEAQPSLLVDRVSIRHHESSPLHPTPWHLKLTGSPWQCWACHSSRPFRHWPHSSPTIWPCRPHGLPLTPTVLLGLL